MNEQHSRHNNDIPCVGMHASACGFIWDVACPQTGAMLDRRVRKKYRHTTFACSPTKPPAISAGGFLFQERPSARTIKEEKPKEQALSNPVLRQCHIAASSSITEGCCSTNVSRAAAVPVGFAWPCSHFVQGKEDNAINGGERWSQGLTYYKLCIISCLFEGETDAVGY